MYLCMYVMYVCSLCMLVWLYCRIHCMLLLYVVVVLWCDVMWCVYDDVDVDWLDMMLICMCIDDILLYSIIWRYMTFWGVLVRSRVTTLKDVLKALYEILRGYFLFKGAKITLYLYEKCGGFDWLLKMWGSYNWWNYHGYNHAIIYQTRGRGCFMKKI